MTRSEEILQKLGGYEKYLEFMNDKSNDDSPLKKELLFMNEEMASLGVMTIDTFDDIQKRNQFIVQHYPNIVVGFCKNSEDKISSLA